MKILIFIQVFLIIFLFFTVPCQALENINADGQAPLFSSYIAPYERSNYFVDEGYHLVYYYDHQPLKLVNESSGEIGIAFKLGSVVVYNIGDYYKKPVVTCSFPDSFQLEAEPFVGLQVVMKFAVYSSAGALGEIHYKNQTDSPLMLYFIYGNSYQKVTSAGVKPDEGITIAYKEPGKGVYFQQDALDGFEEDRYCRFGYNRGIYSWGGFPVYKTNLSADDIAARYKYLNGSLGGELAEWALSFDLDKKYGQFKFTKVTVQKGSDSEKVLKTASEELMKVSFEDIVRFNREKLKYIPGLRFRDDAEKFLFYGGLYLGRQQFLPAAGQFPYPYYVFSREPTWGWGHEGQVFHESLSMHAVALFDPELAMDSQRNFMKVQGKDGYMPYRVGAFFTRTFPANGEKTTSAPFYSWTNLEVFQLAKQSGRMDAGKLDRYLLDSYESGKKFVRYLFQTRDKNKNGLLEWGGHTLLECVRDYLNAVFDLLGEAPETLNQLEALDLSCMVVKEMAALETMARLLGKKAEADEWAGEIKKMADLINRYMWDEETGFYYHVHRDTMNFETPAGISLKRKEIIGFLPLWAGVADKNRAEKLVGHLRNPDEFRRKFGIPTLSAADPYYDPQVLGCCRWNGPVWITWVYPVFRGLLDCGYRNIAEDVLVKMEEAMIFQLRRNHRLWESYSPDFSQLNSPKNYIWDALISRMIYEIRK
jgi:hypothetical protein